MKLSASKFVFIILAITACVAFLYEIWLGKIVFDTKDFMVLASSAFVFYFSYKGKNVDNQSSQISGEPPFAGK